MACSFVNVYMTESASINTYIPKGLGFSGAGSGKVHATDQEWPHTPCRRLSGCPAGLHDAEDDFDDQPDPYANHGELGFAQATCHRGILRIVYHACGELLYSDDIRPDGPVDHHPGAAQDRYPHDTSLAFWFAHDPAIVTDR